MPSCRLLTQDTGVGPHGNLSGLAKRRVRDTMLVASVRTRRNGQVGFYPGKLETIQHRLLEVRYVTDLTKPTAVGEGLIGGVQRGKLVHNALACIR